MVFFFLSFKIDFPISQYDRLPKKGHKFLPPCRPILCKVILQLIPSRDMESYFPTPQTWSWPYVLLWLNVTLENGTQEQTWTVPVPWGLSSFAALGKRCDHHHVNTPRLVCCLIRDMCPCCLHHLQLIWSQLLHMSVGHPGPFNPSWANPGWKNCSTTHRILR